MAHPGPGEFTVELPLFSGPFRALADLLIEQKVDVCDVSVARFTDLFLERGASMVGEWDLEEATWFLAVCALLLELKVGRLLPRTGSITTEEDLLGGASPDLLYARSLELAAFRDLAGRLGELMADAARMLPRMAAPSPEFAHLYPDVMERVTSGALKDVAAGLLSRPIEFDASHLTVIPFTLEDAVEALKARFSRRPQASFRELMADCGERIEVVVRFLAVLELYREGKVEVRQAELFGDIEVRWGEQGRASRASSRHLDAEAGLPGSGAGVAEAGG